MKIKPFDAHLIEIHEFPKRISTNRQNTDVDEMENEPIEETRAGVEEVENEEDPKANQLVIFSKERRRGRRQKADDSSNEYKCKDCGYGTNT